MAPKTAWSASSSLPSDRIPSRTVTPKPNQSHCKKGPFQQNTGLPMSQRVTELSRLGAYAQGYFVPATAHLAKTTSLSDPDPKGGCFCQARDSFVVEREFERVRPLLSPVRRDETHEEEEERLRKEEERCAADGPLPTLAGGPSASMARTPPVEAKTSHKVLSLTGGRAVKGGSGAKKKGRVTIATHTTHTPPPALIPASARCHVRSEEAVYEFESGGRVVRCRGRGRMMHVVGEVRFGFEEAEDVGRGKDDKGKEIADAGDDAAGKQNVEVFFVLISTLQNACKRLNKSNTLNCAILVNPPPRFLYRGVGGSSIQIEDPCQFAASIHAS
ncbi:hypothetical protein DFP72DRAFT_844294 [Ephemerocybe angulata]|uniref:Uncharacterized protein n=1 Tax=Ephemerocybe angulata TaxID=980116 RepID=A0A8H6I862_9AGAR|nr:hypothetical protein DFP72DRAFT_844294 [Tulosesus angulatus]